MRVFILGWMNILYATLGAVLLTSQFGFKIGVGITFLVMYHKHFEILPPK